MNEFTIPQQIRLWSRDYGNKLALISATKDAELGRFSFNDLEEIVKKLQSKFLSLGLSKGDRVIIGGPNSVEWQLFVLALTSLGVVIVPLDTRSEYGFVGRVCDETKPKYTFLSSLECQLANAPLPKILLMKDIMNKDEQCISSANCDVLEEDLYAIVYTSGTTSSPKGVMLSHKNVVSNILGLKKHLDLGDDHVFLSVLPLAHVLEQVGGFLAVLSLGFTIVVPSDRETSTISALLIRYRITAMVVVPYLLERTQNMISDALKKNKVHGLINIIGNLPFRRVLLAPFRGPYRTIQFMISAGAPLLRTTKFFWEKLGVDIIEGYGLTETSPVLAIETRRRQRDGTSGRAIPLVELKIADDGEILAKGPNVFKGYFNNSKATEEAFENGWFKTGDMGEIDKDGFLTIKGRKKYMLLDSRGINIYPEDIEAVMNDHEYIKDSCILATTSEQKLELTGVIVPAGHVKINVENLRDEINAKLANHQQLVHIIVWPDNEFPKTPSLKNKREIIREKIFA